jgi:thioester reductase-like protein
MSYLPPLDLVEAEACLDPSIQFTGALSPRALNPSAVFLTGATGLVASYLLDDLMRNTGATVYCLVRAASDTEAQARLSGHLRRCGLCQGDFDGRIRAIAGDLAEPRFGLSESAFQELAGTVDAIHHSAGWLNMAFPYARLKPANVSGTLEILRLAGLVRTKPLHYLSSMVVYFSDAHSKDPLLRESDPPLYDKTLKGGYSKSKWVADRLVAAAQERGLPACIYRPVRIMGHSRTGATNDLNDVLPLFLKGCILLGKYPALDILVTMVPVDYVTDSIMHLATREDAWGKAYHFFHPNPIVWTDLLGIVQDLGYPMDELSYEQWWRHLKQAVRESDGERKKFLSTVMLALTAPHFLFYNRPPMDAAQLRGALAGTGIECPPIDHELMGTYLSHWQESGFIPMAPQSAAIARLIQC